MSPIPDSNPLFQVHAYHERTKHHFRAYARGPGHMDWTTQPDPFRRYAGAPSIALPLTANRYALPFADLFNLGVAQPEPMTVETLGVLLELSFGLSAWKQYGGERWALRCNPSSGNLHPTEAYAVAANIEGLESGIYHYVSHDHALEQRCRSELPFDGLLVGLASIHWREAWKYGERAYRYCQHDAGHALAALRYAAGVLGWSVSVLDEWSDSDIAAVLGLDKNRGDAEPEEPDLLCWVYPSDRKPTPELAIDALIETVRHANWQGIANRLSQRHLHDWPIIKETAAAARKPRTPPCRENPPASAPLLPTPCEMPAVEIIKQRRSAQAFDGVSAITARAFFRMLDATLPRSGIPPFDAFPWAPRVHLALFVHRVTGLPPGLYMLCRHERSIEQLRQATKEDYGWDTVEGCPKHLRLFRLIHADAREAARIVSCHQEIASDGAFSLGMLAEFDAALQEGPWVYRRLFWETGLIGQALYLEAEAAGVRGTGIGCFFDDPVHELLGLEDTRFQSLYHFTVGSPVNDSRLETLPPYAHLKAG
ncbi:SagB/ThcOx family dehydrogenase [Methylocaldum sp.]|uniref:SagB/ThcOx family dehydrogenase n=1 Tax=Methylocaldum sp. TaxID=1969727 RepID=UPI002D4C88A8|nr:SagB/ThcOx family dehydrogenase [Methylocaldum sp.]HYE37867.1 SagB/ThcOx family dehydrogenase [Methylocaldum sp.]